MTLSFISNNSPIPKNSPELAAKLRSQLDRKTLRIDRASRIMFPLVFMIFNVGYVIYYTTAASNEERLNGESEIPFVPVFPGMSNND